MKQVMSIHDPANKIVSSEDQSLAQCSECELDFKSEYHLNNHMKSSQHAIKAGINRKFGYKLNQKNSIAKLIKGAAKKPMIKEMKSTCAILNLNDGSYFYVVLPLIENWTQKNSTGESIEFEGLNIQVTEVKPGKELSGMVVDVLVKFVVGDSKVVAHCYNTKQKIMVNGSGYAYLVEKYLEPFIKRKIEENIVQIQKYNTVVTEAFGKTQRKNVRYRPGSRLSCNKCDFSADDTSNMSMHKRITHESKRKIVISNIEMNEAITSTRDNTMSEVLNENISVTDLMDDNEDTKVVTKITLTESLTDEVIVPQHKLHCFLCQDGFATEKELTNHEELQHSDHMKGEENNQKLEIKCHLCEYLTKEPKEMDNHVINQHGFVCCDLCEYMAEDRQLVAQHKKKHTGKIIYTCGICEFEATKESILEDHHEIKHTKKNFWWMEKEKSEHFCDKCEKKFQNLFVKRYHLCVQETKYVCPLCEFLGIDLHEIEVHLEKIHTKKIEIKCNLCELVFDSNENIAVHTQTEHKQAQVVISKEDMVKIECDECEYKCTLNIQLRKHKNRKHPNDSEIELKYKCNECDFSSNYLLDSMKHRQSKHPELFQDFTENPKDMALTVVAEQNMEIFQQMEHFKKEVKGCLQALAKDLKDINIANMQAYSNLSTKLDEKMKLINDVIKVDELNGDKHQEKPSGKERTQCDEISKPKENVKKHKPMKHADLHKSSFNQNTKHRVTWVGTSISEALDVKKFEKDTGSQVTVERAYCIENEGRFKDINFSAVVPEIVKKGDVDTLVLQTGSIEITNMEVNKSMMDVEKDLKTFKSECYEKVEKDSENLFSVAENAVAHNPELNVIIVKRLPRYDRSSKDILGLKSQLSKFANHVYDQLWLKRGSPSNIHIVELELGCDNYPRLRNLIYGKQTHDSFDGVHLVGEGGKRHFTYRAIQAVNRIITKPSHKIPDHKQSPRYDDHTNCEQARYQRYNDHTNCEQARYQRRQADRSRQSLSTRRSYADVVRNNTEYTEYKYSVPTKNYYNPLN